MFGNLSFKTKLLLVSASLCLFVAGTTAGVNYFVTYRGLVNNLLSFSDDYLIEFTRNMDSRVDDLKQGIHRSLDDSGLLSRKAFRELMEGADSGNNVEALEASRLGSAILAADPNIRSMVIGDDSGHSYFHSLSGLSAKETQLRSFLQAYKGNRTVLRRMDEDSFAVIKPVIDLKSTAYLGNIAVELDQKFFLTQLKQTDSRNQWAILLLDDNGLFLSGSPGILPHFNFLNELYDFEGIMTRSYRYEKEDYILNTVESAKGYFRVLNIISRKEIRKRSSILLEVVLISSAAVSVAALFLALLFSSGMSRSVTILIEKIKAVSRGEFHTPIVIESNDEFAMIADEVNHMSGEIDSLINEVYKEQISREKAQRKAVEFEYSALVSKMNPHFLYNTLEGINSMAKLAGHEKIGEATCALAELLRESLRDARSIVYLEDEMEYVQKYISLKQMMRSRSFKVEYLLDEMLLGACIPRFILQPVIENAFKYGLDRQQEGLLEIGCALEDGSLQLSVRNSYPLETPKDTEEDDSLWQGSHTGLQNIDKRLKLLYGESAGLSMIREEAFVSVTLTMPYETSPRRNDV